MSYAVTFKPLLYSPRTMYSGLRILTASGASDAGTATDDDSLCPPGNWDGSRISFDPQERRAAQSTANGNRLGMVCYNEMLARSNMAKLKAAGKQQKTSPTKGLIPCLLLVIGGMVFVTLLFYYGMKAG